VHHFQSLADLVELSVVVFTFWFIGVEMVGMLVWLAYVIVSKSVLVL
jgi:hypothetical protein